MFIFSIHVTKMLTL